jgi:ATPase family associated with various cellular activities (AAA)
LRCDAVPLATVSSGISPCTQIAATLSSLIPCAILYRFTQPSFYQLQRTTWHILVLVCVQMSPTIVFIDEIDAVGSKRYDSNSGGTREIQRTMLELLNQLDGFDERGDVKVGLSLHAHTSCRHVSV